MGINTVRNAIISFINSLGYRIFYNAEGTQGAHHFYIYIYVYVQFINTLKTVGINRFWRRVRHVLHSERCLIKWHHESDRYLCLCAQQPGLTLRGVRFPWLRLLPDTSEDCAHIRNRAHISKCRHRLCTLHPTCDQHHYLYYYLQDQCKNTAPINNTTFFISLRLDQLSVNNFAP